MSDQVRLVLSHLLLEVELAQKLHSKLLEEEQVLIHNDLTQLQAITDGKSEIITNYLSIKDARFSKLSQAGLNFDENQFIFIKILDIHFFNCFIILIIILVNVF